MTPEEAQELRDQLEFFEPDGDTVAEALETVANLRYEYAVEVQPVPGGAWHQVTRWTPDPSPVLPDGRKLGKDERVVRRLVGDQEVVDE